LGSVFRAVAGGPVNKESFLGAGLLTSTW